MAKREYLLRYLLIIKKLQKGTFRFKEISEYLDRQSELQDFDFRISPRTLQRDILEIRSMFNIDIQYDFSKKGYYIVEESQTDSNARMLEAFEMFNALNLTDELTRHVHFENRKPQGTEHFYGILHAIKNCFEINVQYFKYEEEETVHRNLHPLLLKEFKDRWYLMAVDSYHGVVKTYGLDRILDLEITKKKFTRPGDFDPDEFFRHCFGITKPADQDCEQIILSFDYGQGKYIKSFPLHHSQQVLIDNDDETRIKLSLFITIDFVMELLQYGDRVKILQPESLQKTLCENL
jgi:predicted DNA-binding transcriptional regulator YafY